MAPAACARSAAPPASHLSADVLLQLLQCNRPDQTEQSIARQWGAVNDDHILACAVHFAHRQHRGSGHSAVVLLTLDKVFAVKAMTHGLAALPPSEYARRWPCEHVAAGMWSSAAPAAAAPPPQPDDRAGASTSRWGSTALERAQSAVNQKNTEPREQQSNDQPKRAG